MKTVGTGRSRTEDESRHQFFTRSRKKRESSDHVGRTSNIQTFFEAPDFDETDPKWVEHAPPTLPQAKKVKQESAAVQVFKRRVTGTRREEFYIHKIILQSPYLRDALKPKLELNGIIYTDANYAESVVPHHGLFFALDHIAHVSHTADDEITRNHCEILCSIIEEVFSSTLDELETLDAEQKITFPLLWTLFAPGTVFGTQPYTDAPQAIRVKRHVQFETSMWLSYEMVYFDGYRYGTILHTLDIYSFEGTVYEHAIPGFTYINLSKNPEIRRRLLERGKKALDLQTIRYMTYRPGHSKPDQQNSTWRTEHEERRVIVDPHLYCLRRSFWNVTPLPGYQKIAIDDLEEEKEAEEDVEINGEFLEPEARKPPSPRLRVRTKARARSMEVKGGDSTTTKSNWREDKRRPNISQIEQNRKVVLQDENNLLIMSRYVAGFSLDRRTWDIFYVEHLYPVEADETVFEKVVLDPAKKDIIKTLVESHKDGTSHNADLIRGKGECLLILLSGPPGTGKTLMAESLAEHLACPLLRADPAYIQQDMLQIMQGYDASLGQFLKDATEWGGIVLFDEPDFLFQTQEVGADRSQLLAFLRQAEYFKGIIFLTTNLGRSIDPAVISRAQIHIRFPALTPPLRIRVWANFDERLPEDVGGLTASDIEQLARWRVNGREIKNILNMSVSWCRKKKCRLNVATIENIMRTICSSAKLDDEGSGSNGLNGTGEDESMSNELSLLEL